MVRELIKAYCIGGAEDRALALLTTAHGLYGVTPTAMCYEPILFNYAVLKALPDVTEDVLMMLINRGVGLTDCIVDSLVLCHIRHNELPEALDRIVDCFNMHGVRPTTNTVLRFIHCILHYTPYTIHYTLYTL